MRRRRLVSFPVLIGVVALVMMMSPVTASAALVCPENLLGFAREGVTVELTPPCVSTTVGATVDYDIYHPGTGAHFLGTPHYPLPGVLSTLAAPTNGYFGFPSPGVVTYTPAGAAGTADFFEYAATDDGGTNWTVFPVHVQITSLTQTVFETPPVGPTIPLSASIETTGTTGVTIAGRAPTTAQPPGLTFLGDEYFIEAPDQSVESPLRVTVTVAASVMNALPPGSIPLEILRNGVVVDECEPVGPTRPVGSAVPDPCWESKDFVSGPGSNYRFVVLSSHASVYNVAAPDPPVTYPFSGFLSPVNDLPVLNVSKGGSAIPVKFSLGGDQGLDILAADYPKSERIACDTLAPLDTIESTVTAGASSLQYDPASGVYTYVWKTDKSWAGSCRRLDVKFDDGTTHSANFKFK